MKDNVSVAFITEFSEIGGGESNLFQLAKELSSQINVAVFCPKGKLFELCKNAKIPCFPIVPIFFKGWIKGIPLINFKKKLLRDLESFDVVHAYSLHILPTLFFLRTPLVWTNHGVWENVRGLRAWMLKRITSKIITVSYDTYKYAMVSEQLKRNIHLGAPLPEFAKPAVLRFDEIIISCIARFQKIKGQDLLLSAIERLGIRNPNQVVKVFFVGDVNYLDKENVRFKDAVIQKASTLTYLKNIKIIFEGFKSDVTPYYQKSHLIVIPSRYESFSMVAIESLSYGKPIVAPNCGGPKDIINSAAVGELFLPEDSDDLASAIQRVINKYHTYDYRAIRRRAEHFSIKNQARQHLAIYKEIIV